MQAYIFVYIGVFALLLNLIVVGIGMAIMKAMNKVKDEGIIDNSDLCIPDKHSW